MNYLPDLRSRLVKVARLSSMAFMASSTLSLFPTEAWATPSYPGVIATTVSAKKEPECAVCHVNGVTGLGTVNTPFGKTMRSRGLRPNDEGSLKTALAAITAEKKDSNGDGTTDIEALKAGLDPNGSASVDGGSGGVTTPETIEYGCARVAPRGASDAPLAGLGVVAVVLALRSRRRRSA